VIVKYYKEATAVANAISFNTLDLRGLCYRIYIEPATSTTTYNFIMTDDNGLEVYKKRGLKGTKIDIDLHTLKGIYTVSISNISKNELFKVQIEYEEIV